MNPTVTQILRCFIKLLLISSFNLPIAHGVYLEQLKVNDLKNTRIAYYPGSFDPLHFGHIAVIKTVLDNDLADYVLIYALPESDHKKNRTSLCLRHRMLESIYKDHPKVIITKLSPANLQEKLLPAFNCIQFSVVQGSDVIRDYVHITKYDALWMKGIPIKKTMPKHSNTALGAIMAIPATQVIAFNREGDDLSFIGKSYKRRPVRILSTPSYSDISSTKVRNAMKMGESVTEFVPKEVFQIIQENNLYK